MKGIVIMKQSVFNLFFPYDEKVDSTIIYNTRTNALALLDKTHYEVLRKFIENNEKINDEDFIQSLFSTGYVVDDEILIVNKESDTPIRGTEYVVFDTETTGFYVGSDQMIEIGAVKIKNGEIIERFDELTEMPRRASSSVALLIRYYCVGKRLTCCGLNDKIFIAKQGGSK